MLWRAPFKPLVALVMVATMWSAVPARADHIPPRESTLVIGKVSDNPRKHYGRLKPMVDYVAAHMADLGVNNTRVLMARDNEQMIEYLREGKVDWVTETPFSAVVFEQEAGAEPVLKKWKTGVPSYHSVIFVRKDSGINQLADLLGKTVAFEDAGSTSAYFLPAAAIQAEGLSLVRLSSPREAAPPDGVGYAFSGEEVNTATWVYKGLVEAGALSNLDWDKKAHLSDQSMAELKVIHRSQSYPRAIELVGRSLSDDRKQRLIQVLLAAHEDRSAAKALRAYQKTTRFEALDDTDRQALTRARALIAGF